MSQRFRLLLILLSCVLAPITMHATTATTTSETKTKAAALRKEGDALEAEQASLSKIKDQLASLKIQLTEEDADIKRQYEVGAEEEKQLGRDSASFNQDASYFNSYCNAGHLSQAEVAARTSWCSAHKGPLESEKESLAARDEDLMKRSGQLKTRRENLNQRTLDWAAKQKKLNADQDDLQARTNDWLKRLNTFLASSTVVDLRKRADVGKSCQEIPTDASGGYPFERILNGAAEKAHHCLQTIWDGAR
jgi:peptidoglycan hydrolase CwlO-like protein